MAWDSSVRAKANGGIAMRLGARRVDAMREWGVRGSTAGPVRLLAVSE